MRLVEFLEFGGNEIANSARTTAYARGLGVPGLTMAAECPCSAIDQGYTDPVSDDAPWYEPTRPESAEFFGLYAHTINLAPVMSRTVTPAGRSGSFIAPARYTGRQVQVTGTMVAQSAQGQAYGERWLAEVLRGVPCDSGCAGDDICILPACPEDDYSEAFRHLVNAGAVDGPIFGSIGDLPECYIQEVSFNLVSSQPYLYHPVTRCIDSEDIAYGLACSLTTPTWMGEGTFVIDITNTDSSPTTDILITGRISLDGSCPVTGTGTSVPHSFTYTIPSLAPEDRIVIDGIRRQARYYDASAKVATSALPYMTWEGGFTWPDVGTCTTLCVEIEGSGGDAVVTVDNALREL